jgi:hypothetical protein
LPIFLGENIFKIITSVPDRRHGLVRRRQPQAERSPEPEEAPPVSRDRQALGEPRYQQRQARTAGQGQRVPRAPGASPGDCPTKSYKYWFTSIGQNVI